MTNMNCACDFQFYDALNIAQLNDFEKDNFNIIRMHAYPMHIVKTVLSKRIIRIVLSDEQKCFKAGL